MNKSTAIHYVIGICALLLALAALYYINQNKQNWISAGIIGFAACFVAISQYLIIKNKKKK